MKCVLARLALMLGPLCGLLGSDGRNGEPAPLPLEARVPRLETAERQLAHARGLKRALRHRREERERLFWRTLTVEAYQAVRFYHPDENALCAEAAFRAGELLRAAADAEGALREFRVALRRGRGTPFRARAGLEIGHVHRRAARDRPALDAYLDVASDAQALPRHRDDAWLWAASMWRRAGRIEEARSAWRGVARGAEDPLDRIRAFDRLALSWLDEDDPEAAAGALDECLEVLSAVALEETLLGERVRNALLRMEVIDALQRRIARRERSSR